MKELIFATHNSNKAVEVRAVLPGGVTVITLQDLGFKEDIPETGETLEENALIKAKTIFAAYGKDCFADDTGLEVGSLNGEPGVFSARYAGVDCNPEDNIARLLNNLIGKSDRNARFRTIFALILNGKEHLFEGIVEGKIISEKRGHSGFGYDPVFVPDGFTQTFAEMSMEEKNTISHRARALKKMAGFVRDAAK